jgi:glucose dehydrogenase
MTPRAPLLAAVPLLIAAALPVAAQTGAKNGEWPTYCANLGDTRHSPLYQINAGNFNQLELARHRPSAGQPTVCKPRWLRASCA